MAEMVGTARARLLIARPGRRLGLGRQALPPPRPRRPAARARAGGASRASLLAPSSAPSSCASPSLARRRALHATTRGAALPHFLSRGPRWSRGAPARARVARRRAPRSCRAARLCTSTVPKRRVPRRMRKRRRHHVGAVGVHGHGDRELDAPEGERAKLQSSGRPLSTQSAIRSADDGDSEIDTPRRRLRVSTSCRDTGLLISPHTKCVVRRA